MTMTHIDDYGSEHVYAMVALLRSQWPKRFEDEIAEEQWLKTVVDELRCYAPEVTNEAGRAILRKKLRGFPLIAELHDACQEARRMQEYRNPKLREKPGAAREDFPWKRATDGALKPRFGDVAETIITGPLGRQAAREGWVLVLRDWIARNGRQPDEIECRQLRRTAAETSELYRSLTSHDGHGIADPAMRKKLISFAEGILERNRQLSARILGDDDAGDRSPA